MTAFVLRDLHTDRERVVWARSPREAASLADNEEVVA